MILTVEDIMEILPHRYPFLLVDRIIELDPMKRAVGIKKCYVQRIILQRSFSRVTRLCLAYCLLKQLPRLVVLRCCIRKKTAA